MKNCAKCVLGSTEYCAGGVGCPEDEMHAFCPFHVRKQKQNEITIFCPVCEFLSGNHSAIICSSSSGEEESDAGEHDDYGRSDIDKGDDDLNDDNESNNEDYSSNSEDSREPTMEE
jgi:hypothetical protein